MREGIVQTARRAEVAAGLSRMAPEEDRAPRPMSVISEGFSRRSSGTPPEPLFLHPVYLWLPVGLGHRLGNEVISAGNRT